jgi:hypothetical protein
MFVTFPSHTTAICDHACIYNVLGASVELEVALETAYGASEHVSTPFTLMKDST